MHRAPYCLAVLAFLLAPVAGTDDVHPRDGQRSFKGWELYIWRKGAEWRFALLVGTNRLKSCSEVRNPRGALDLAGAEEALGQLDQMEYVSWNAPFERRSQADCPDARPPSEMVERLWLACQRRHLHCVAWEEQEP